MIGDEKTNARHEAAHAVVAIRLGLPLDSTSALREDESPDVSEIQSRGREMVGTVGHTRFPPEAVSQWVRALPNPSAVDMLERMATMAAAGIETERIRGTTSDVPNSGDVEQILAIAAHLGRSPEEFKTACASRAFAVLRQDKGAAWHRVTEALHRERRLTAEQVRTIMGD